MIDDPPRLLLVYNADGGLFAKVSDAVHKVVSPQTYTCSLCAVTYGALTMRGEWKAFLQRLPNEIVFHHRDDFARAWPAASFDLPAILVERNGALGELVGARDLQAIGSVAALSELVEARLAQAQRV